MFSQKELLKYEKSELVKAYTDKLDELKIKLLKKFETLQNEVEINLTEIKKSNLITESNNNINKLHVYLTKYSEEKLSLYKLEQDKNKIEGELYDYYRNHSDVSSKLKSESSISKYVNAHPCFQAINQIYGIQEVIVNYLKSVTEMLRDRNFTIKNIIEVTKIELGLT